MNKAYKHLRTMLSTVLMTMLGMVVPQDTFAQGKFISEPCVAAYDGESETGTEDHPIEINNADVFIQVMSNMQTDENARSLHYKLTADIDCFYAGPNVFLSNTFKGTFDGDGHALVNLRNTGDLENSRSVSLFQNIEGATIKNLTIHNAIISAKDEGSIKISGGILCDKAVGSTIENCHIVGGSFYHGKGDGTEMSVFGAIAGKASQTSITHCSSSLAYTLNADGEAYGGVKTAGLVGRVEDCYLISCIVYGEKLESCDYPLVCDIVKYNFGAQIKDCYVLKGKLTNESVTDCHTNQDGVFYNCDYVSESNLHTGRAAWLLNGQADAGFWHQRLANDGDELPNTLQYDNTKVYRVRKKGCDGEYIDEAYIYTNDPTIIFHDMTFYPKTRDVATCLNPLNFDYWYCERCNNYYHNAQGTEDSKFTPAPKQHAEMTPHGSQKDCIGGTIYDHWYCADCDNSFSQNDRDTDDHFICHGHYVEPSPYQAHDLYFVTKSTGIGALETCLNKSIESDHWHCRRCNGNFSDEEGKNPISAESKPHTFSDMYHVKGGYFNRDSQTRLADGTTINLDDRLDGNHHAFIPEHWYCAECKHFFTSANKNSDEGLILSPIETAEHNVVDAGPYEDSSVRIMQCACGHGRYYTYDAGRDIIRVVPKDEYHTFVTVEPLEFTIIDGKTFVIGDDINLEAEIVAYGELWTKGRKWGTKCLPFDFMPSKARDNFRFYRMKSIVLDTNPAGIMLEEVESDKMIPAGTPLFVKALDPDIEAFQITASAEELRAVSGLPYDNVRICATKDNRGARDDDSCQPFILKGVLENFVFDSQSRNTNGYYISADKLWHATSKFSVKPYRAYIENASKDSGSQAAAKTFVLMTDDGLGTTSVEGIADFDADGKLNVTEIFDLNGRRITEPMAGRVYIVKDSHGIKKVTR